MCFKDIAFMIPHKIFFFPTFHNKNKAIFFIYRHREIYLGSKEISILFFCDMINPKRHIWIIVMSVAVSNKLLNWNSLTKPRFVCHSCNSSLRMFLIHGQLSCPKELLLLCRLVTPTTTALSGLSQQRKGREKTHICFSHLVPIMLYPSTLTQVAEISHTVSLKSKEAVMWQRWQLYHQSLRTAILNGFYTKPQHRSHNLGTLVSWSPSATRRSAKCSKRDACTFEPKGFANSLKAIKGKKSSPSGRDRSIFLDAILLSLK